MICTAAYQNSLVTRCEIVSLLVAKFIYCKEYKVYPKIPFSKNPYLKEINPLMPGGNNRSYILK